MWRHTVHFGAKAAIGVFTKRHGWRRRHWERIFHVSDNTGFSDLWMDPRDPNTMYAAAHQRRRHTWTYLSGGPESAIYKTTDGGAKLAQDQQWFTQR